MNEATSEHWAKRLEHRGFGALVALLLSPVLAQGLWRPLVHVFGPAGGAEKVTLAALLIAVIVIVARQGRLGRAPWLPLVLGAVAAALTSVGLSLGLPGLLTLLAVAAANAWLARWLPPRLPAALDGLAGRHPRLTALYACFALLSVVSIARLSIFIGDPARVDLQALPGEKFVETHSCLSAYVRASALVRRGVDNVYDDRWWAGSNGLSPLPAGAVNPYRPFSLDNFSYPPPFLLLVSPLAPLEGDFHAQRALWFGLNGLWLAFGLWLVARWIDGPGAHRVLLLAPLFFGSMPVLVTLQIGNFHIAAVLLSVLAMVAFDRDRPAAGGLLLALAILSKVSPGVLGVVLLAQRRFRAAAFAAGFGGLLLALSLLCFGRSPLTSFVRHALPRLSSGAAFPFMDTESGILTNLSPFGIPFKLRFLGLDVGDPFRLAPSIAHVYTVGLVALAVVAARRGGDRRSQAVTWMSLLVLAAMQSPFSPAYATIGLLWATTLLAVDVRRAREGIALALLWVLVLVVPPGLSPALRVVLSMMQTALILGVSAWLIVRVPPGLGRSGPAPVP
jgi:hypothetical protein